MAGPLPQHLGAALRAALLLARNATAMWKPLLALRADALPVGPHLMSPFPGHDGLLVRNKRMAMGGPATPDILATAKGAHPEVAVMGGN